MTYALPLFLLVVGALFIVCGLQAARAEKAYSLFPAIITGFGLALGWLSGTEWPT